MNNTIFEQLYGVLPYAFWGGDIPQYPCVKEIKNLISEAENQYNLIKTENDKLKEDLTALSQIYNDCEKEYRALTTRYHNLQSENRELRKIK